LIETIDLIFKKKNLKLLLTPYEILSTGENCGIVEFIADSMSIDYLKRKMPKVDDKDNDLEYFYKSNFGYYNNKKSKKFK